MALKQAYESRLLGLFSGPWPGECRGQTDIRKHQVFLYFSEWVLPVHHVMADGNFLKKGRKTVRSCLLVKRPGSGLGSLGSGAMSFGALDTYREFCVCDTDRGAICELSTWKPLNGWCLHRNNQSTCETTEGWELGSGAWGNTPVPFSPSDLVGRWKPRAQPFQAHGLLPGCSEHSQTTHATSWATEAWK